MPFRFSDRPVLVTGGAGFIGSHLAERLVAEGCEVHVMDDLSGGVRSNVPEGAVFHELDIRSREAAALFGEHNFAALCHLAAQMDVRRSVADPKFDAEVNVLGFLNLLEAGRQTGLEKVAFASTGGAIYGEPDPSVNDGGPQPESHPTLPMSPYGITKLVSEHYLRFYGQTYGIESAALRFGNVYGPRQNPHGEAGVVAIFAQRLLRGEPITINGPGTQTRDYVFVKDVVAAFMAALEKEATDIYNVGTGVETDVNQLFHHINRLTEAGADEIHGPAKAGEQQRSVLDISHTSDALGWMPAVDVATGLEKTVAWFKEQERA
ncbi:UDP-glucose 4-epimerase [Rubrivirga sp. SAORIC476]|uniref:NAD-dependent epimerase/dehydratase family protein n=1 Tax=Rubrivirga sp. SAORIC476 TaxID=1961794 RepID=UPI000BA9936D|nr:NAD-dependent epimerase/dehydratase family protein [Rubrivirga sp. SAORIC476]MBC13267.1 UDP-glucose 4-epimerase [Rhodothermaceae bacterium]PAP82220.1 UDP-glucose 4-epimerase [Rubrivirga sp. SAORIC476]